MPARLLCTVYIAARLRYMLEAYSYRLLYACCIQVYMPPLYSCSAAVYSSSAAVYGFYHYIHIYIYIYTYICMHKQVEFFKKNKKKSPKPKNPSEKALSARKGAYEARDVRKRKKQRRHRLGGSKTSKCMCGFVGVRGAQPRHMLAQSAS